MREPSLETVLSLVSYDPSTGIFTNLKARGGLKVGERAGYVGLKGYRMITIAGWRGLEHRLAWFICNGWWPEDQIDHRNTIKDDNRIDNLREASNTGNQTSKPMHQNRGLPRGVQRIKGSSRFMAQLTHNYRSIYLGMHDTPEEAGEAYRKKHLDLHGEFSIFAKGTLQ